MVNIQGRHGLRHLGGIAVLVAALGLAACEKKPGGQVIAVVNDNEITQQEVQAEAVANNLGGAMSDQPGRTAMLQRVVERNLLADYAREKGLDRKPEFIARRRQAEETLLAELAMRDMVGSPKPPTDAEAQAFIARNPTLFSQRQQLALEEIRFPTPDKSETVKKLTKMNTVDEIALQLKAEGIEYERNRRVLDTGTVTPGIARQIVALPDGAMFDVSRGGLTYINRIMERRPVNTPPASWIEPAKQAVAREKVAGVAAKAVAELRKNAKIQYDPAWRPSGGATPAKP